MSQYCKELEEEVMYLEKAIMESKDPSEILMMTEDLQHIKAALKCAAPLLEEEAI